MLPRSALISLLISVTVLGTLAGCTSANNDDSRETVSISDVTPENIGDLLTIDEVREVASEHVSETEDFNYKEMAESVSPAQVEKMDTWLGRSFQTEDRTMMVTFSLIDFDSSVSAQAHFERIQVEAFTESLDSGVGEQSFGGQFDEAGLTAIFGFLKGDKVIQLLSTTQSEGRSSLVDLDGLIDLGRTIDARLAD